VFLAKVARPTNIWWRAWPTVHNKVKLHSCLHSFQEFFSWQTKYRIQRRIFIFGALGYFKLGALLEGLRRLMSYKLALHVLVTFTEEVARHKHITSFWIPSIAGTNTVTMKLTKKAVVKLSDHTPITYLLSSSVPVASCHLQNGFRRFVPQMRNILNATKREYSYAIHFNPLHSFF